MVLGTSPHSQEGLSSKLYPFIRIIHTKCKLKKRAKHCSFDKANTFLLFINIKSIVEILHIVWHNLLLWEQCSVPVTNNVYVVGSDNLRAYIGMEGTKLVFHFED